MSLQNAPPVGSGYFSLSAPVCRSKVFKVEGGCLSIVDRRKACPQCFGFFVCENSQDPECGLVVRLNPGFGGCGARLHHVDGSRSDATDDDSTIRGRGDALRVNLFPGDVEFSGRRRAGCGLPDG